MIYSEYLAYSNLRFFGTIGINGGNGNTKAPMAREVYSLQLVWVFGNAQLPF